MERLVKSKWRNNFFTEGPNFWGLVRQKEVSELWVEKWKEKEISWEEVRAGQLGWRTGIKMVKWKSE